jgi:predicted Zn finger-like uncharacterized protein
MSKRTAFFRCPNCEAHYHVVKIEAGPETQDCELKCRACGGRLTAREGKCVLKYFFLENRRQQRVRSNRRRAPPESDARLVGESFDPR